MATNPTLLAMPLAENGTKNVIPETQATAGDGLFSQSTGFPAETSLPLGAGGVAPSREDFNGLANLLGGVAYYAQKGWQFQFDAAQEYFAGCIVRDTTDGKLYECLNDVAAGGSVPAADAVNWKEFGVDTSTLANTDLSNLTATGEQKLTDTTESVVYENGFAIIYPNGGSESSPANVTNNSRYVETNPFPGYDVFCIAELLDNGVWGETGGPEAYSGTKSFFYNGSIVIQTASSYVLAGPSSQHLNPFGFASGSNNKTTAPCRVKVWKVGKVANNA